ncbi:glycosyltransferase family 2 protein [Butyrivibrio sp. YAB3001]|uniref:glycosyltransferase family 2 protein n=1 Tax=Butyrivibrio sp. YAB3001 TaxID=1520812 RepID=UPI0008F64674|nr:glycosyltransferase family 2 protein [Butyrivibrio sp. YAB3001]SFC94225.1 Glycosyl transferase family 2 [Butyrivibrio sp. YAB3001]
MPKISVIMPIYNTGPQLYKTLMSLLGQKEKDFEVLMIDDCSTDELTISTEQTFSRFDSRFKLFRQDHNLGAAECRNLGIQKSSGLYIIFLDSDDLFHNDLLLSMSNTLDQANADVCVCNLLMLDTSNNETSPIRSKRISGITDRVFSLEELGEDAFSFWMPVPWNKMYKRSFITENNLYFQTLSNCNDFFFGYMSVIKANSIVYCYDERPLVIYHVNNAKQISYQFASRNIFKAFSL